MKKVGMLTFHYAMNHGAVLQAYALYKTINSFPDCQAEIINYMPEGYVNPIMPNGGTADEQREKRKKFNRFLADNCGIGTPKIHSVNGNKYDVYVVGSDQVWNTDIPEAAGCEYFLPHLSDEAKRIAYSASVGMEFEKINRKLFREYLPKFCAISLRERSYQKTISELSGKECEYTLDPSMLLRPMDYELLMEKPVVAEDGYLLYFMYGGGESGMGSIETVNALARKYGLSVKHTFPSKSSVIRQLFVNDGGCMFHDGIGEFLWHVKNAQAVVTNSFHGAVFSMLFQRPLFIVYPEKRRCRQENLVDMFRLQDRVIQGYVHPDQLNLEMNYDFIFSIMEKERERSRSWLKNTIETVLMGEI